MPRGEVDGAGFDEDGWPVLHLAAEQGHEGVVRLLLAFHADPDKRTEFR